MPATMSAGRLWPAARSISMACVLWSRRRGICLADVRPRTGCWWRARGSWGRPRRTPRWPRRAATIDDEQRALGPQLAAEAAHRAAEVLGLGRSACASAWPPGPPGRGRRGRAGAPAAPAAGAACGVFVLRRCSCDSLRAELRGRRSRGTSRCVSSSSSCVPMPAMVPSSSSTTIWSACMMVPTRWATMITVASAVCVCRAARSLASVVKSSAEKLSS